MAYHRSFSVMPFCPLGALRTSVLLIQPVYMDSQVGVLDSDGNWSHKKQTLGKIKKENEMAYKE